MAGSNEPTTINDLLKRDVILEAPVFQRRFAWQEKQLADFWEDFNGARDHDSDTVFLGAVILRPESPSTASTAERWLIIDGQQRLTALSLLVAAICLEAIATQGTGDTATQEFVTNQVRRYLLPQSHGNLKNLETKVMVTTPDLDDYRAAIGLVGIDEVLPLKRKANMNSKIHRALEFHREQVKDRVGAAAKLENYTALLEELVSKVELIEIHLAERHDPNEVFNRLNTKGAELTLGDLVRNEAFGRFSTDREGANRAFQSHWRQFEDRFPTDDSREAYYWPFTLAAEPTATKGKAFSLLRKRWLGLSDAQKGEDAEAAIKLIVEDLGRYVDAFCLLHDGRRFEGLTGQVTGAALRLQRMKLPSVTYSFLLQVLDAARTKDLASGDAATTLGIVESFLVRRALIGLEPTGLHAVFKRLWGKSRGQPGAVRTGLVTSTIAFPSDDDILRELPTVNMYRRRLAPYILGEYERAHTKGDPLSEDQLTKFTIDHAAPQSFESRWIREYGLVRDAISALLNSWGNLVPLSAIANSTKGASDWVEARGTLGNETVYKTTKDLLDDYADWTPREIRARTNHLTEWAISRWPDYSAS
ncbi:MAG: DUF262 domain-containing protein [Tepidiformaceae bacterium]